MPSEDPYEAVAHHLPNDVRIGGALITMVEPHPGHERAYNRWYEDDHFYAGATAGPWMFAGRRYVATRDLQLLRYPEDSPVAQPVTIILPLNAPGRSGTAFIAADNRILFLSGKVDPKAGTVTITVNDFRFGGGESGAQ